jgi:hypothetical protein
LDALIEAIRKAWSDAGLWFVQDISDGDIPHAEGNADAFKVLETTVTHSSGQWLKTGIPVMIRAGMNAQEIGSELTYKKRYALALTAGLASDEDDDGNAAVGNTLTEMSERGGGAKVVTAPVIPATPKPQTTPIAPTVNREDKRGATTSPSATTDADKLAVITKAVETLKDLGLTEHEALDDITGFDGNKGRVQIETMDGLTRLNGKWLNSCYGKAEKSLVKSLAEAQAIAAKESQKARAAVVNDDLPF